jgi:hypothetical protein
MGQINDDANFKIRVNGVEYHLRLIEFEAKISTDFVGTPALDNLAVFTKFNIVAQLVKSEAVKPRRRRSRRKGR